ncbi:hypothetical protein Hypma_008311 [Hypsizygus marmoreus]|uniref:Uncharacterized protein n=1 Tax=Hypsizygus marmoreus TaxID=39966 RepID=A0A369JQH9_HYPMA|nr:hypothetical protein Hypma_008311 [Hypsizygus marmoreus]
MTVSAHNPRRLLLSAMIQVYKLVRTRVFVDGARVGPDWTRDSLHIHHPHRQFCARPDATQRRNRSQ